ncbi:hypothetical protein [Helicobacter sp. T3_23-1059]
MQNQQNKWGKNQGRSSTQQTSKTSKTNKIQIPTPIQEELESYLKAFQTDFTMRHYLAQESALKKLFKAYHNNTNLDEIIIKVATLNSLYGTNIFNIFAVAEHISHIKHIDERLKSGDEKLVSEIAKSGLKNKNGKEIIFYSFATKFCSFHNSEKYAIYDSFVAKVLTHFKQDFKQTFNQNDLRDYGKFMEILCAFQRHYKLSATLRDLDLYLWQLGKKHFKSNQNNVAK